MTIHATSREYLIQQCHLLDESMIKVKHCLGQLETEQIWWRPPNSPGLNSIGNLLLHLAGNLTQWGVVPFSQQTDQRNRESEFVADQNLPASQLIESLEEVVDTAKQLFMNLDDASLLQAHTIQGFTVTSMAALTHTCSHFVGHVHQIIQLTRLQLGDRYQFQWQPDAAKNNVPI